MELCCVKLSNPVVPHFKDHQLVIGSFQVAAENLDGFHRLK